jgi:hypothetical protein
MYLMSASRSWRGARKPTVRGIRWEKGHPCCPFLLFPKREKSGGQDRRKRFRISPWGESSRAGGSIEPSRAAEQSAVRHELCTFLLSTFRLSGNQGWGIRSPIWPPFAPEYVLKPSPSSPSVPVAFDGVSVYYEHSSQPLLNGSRVPSPSRKIATWLRDHE